MMKKYLLSLAVLGALLGVGAPSLAGQAVKAEKSYIYGQNLIPNGDFKNGAGEYVLPSGAPSEGVIAGIGVLGADIAPVALKEEGNETNTVLRFAGGGFSSFFKMLSIEAGSTYDISFNYKVVGSTDNIGFAFWNTTDVNRVPEVNIMDANQNKDCVFVDLENGWKKVSTVRTFAEGKVFDSMHFWVNASGTNVIYVDNISIVKQGSEANIFTGGDFEGFLDYAISEFSAEPNDDGLYGVNASLGSGFVSIGNQGKYGYTVDGLSKDLYTLDIKHSGELVSDANLSFTILGEETTLKTIEVIKDGALVSGSENTFTTTFEKVSDAKKVELVYTGSKAIEVSLFSLRETFENVFDPNTTYYAGDNMVVNGDFEAFEVGTKFSEEQLEGAWGSVTSYDNGGRILSDGGSNVAAIGKIDENDTKTYSSMFLMTPDDINVGDLIRLSYDYKLTMSDDPMTYTEINSCFVGGANVSYYLIDLRQLGIDASYENTSGAETVPYKIKSQVLENGYTRVTLDFQVAIDKVQWNSIRWLYPAHNVGDVLYVDNVEIRSLSTTPPVKEVTSVKINSEDIELKVGESSTLTATVLPDDAENKAITWSSSNEEVATVDQNGKVTALKEGTAEISATASNGKKDSIVVTVLAAPKPAKKGCGGSIIASSAIIASLSLVGIALVLLKKRKIAKQL